MNVTLYTFRNADPSTYEFKTIWECVQTLLTFSDGEDVEVHVSGVPTFYGMASLVIDALSDKYGV